MEAEGITYILKRVLNLLLMKDPRRLGHGVLLGCAVVFVHQALSTITLGRGKGLLYEGSELHLWLLGIFWVNVPAIIKTIRSTPEFDEDIEAAFRMIKHAEDSGVSRIQVRLMYRNLCETVIERIASQHKGITPADASR
jgi:hypothetical protein